MSSFTFRSGSTQDHRCSTTNTLNEDFKLVVGIDLATTRCCLATGLRSIDRNRNDYFDVRTYSCWPASYESGSKWPITALLYLLRQPLPKTGNILEAFFKTPGSKSCNLNNHFRQWKLLFHDHKDDPATKRLQDDLLLKLSRAGKTHLNLLEDWVRIIFDEVFILRGNGLYTLNGSSDYGSFTKEQIEIVVTVPPGRSVLAHDEVREAFVQGPVGTGQVFLVSEPEAMFRSYVHDGADVRDFKIGSNYLIVDGGGGTCCLVLYRLDRLEPLGFQQEFESESLVGGAEAISNLFEEKIGEYIPAGHANRSWVLDRLRRNFDDLYKPHIGGDDDATSYTFEVPGSNEEINISRAEILDCFDRCIAKLIQAIHRQLERVEKVDYLVLGGGLFNSQYVMQAIRKEFGDNMEIRTLSADKSHVARGAVLCRNCGPFIIRRPILRSKAVTTWLPVTTAPIKPSLSKKLAVTKGKDGKDYYYAAQWLAKQGTEAKVKHAGDMHEIETESTFDTARTRQFDLSLKDPTFSEIILTFNYTPSQSEGYVVQLKDNTWANMEGIPIPPPRSEEVNWNLRKLGVVPQHLERHTSKGNTFVSLRYALQMQMQEVGTTYFIRAWSWTRPWKQPGRVLVMLRSRSHESEAVFKSQEISQNLSESYALGPGTQKSLTSRISMEPERVPVPTHRPQTSVTSSPPPNGIPRESPRVTLDGSSPQSQIQVNSDFRYTIGERRNNGGCWTCAFRKRYCDQAAPECTYCRSLGLVCEYGFPNWWYDPELRERQKDINRTLIKDFKARQGPKRRRTGASGASNASPLSAPPRSTVAPGMRSNAYSNLTPIPSIEPLTDVRDELTCNRKGKRAIEGKDSEADLYYATPPPKKRPPLGWGSSGRDCTPDIAKQAMSVLKGVDVRGD